MAQSALYLVSYACVLGRTLQSRRSECVVFGLGLGWVWFGLFLFRDGQMNWTIFDSAAALLPHCKSYVLFSQRCLSLLLLYLCRDAMDTANLTGTFKDDYDIFVISSVAWLCVLFTVLVTYDTCLPRERTAEEAG